MFDKLIINFTINVTDSNRTIIMNYFIISILLKLVIHNYSNCNNAAKNLNFESIS